jgi:hypothetical protein
MDQFKITLRALFKIGRDYGCTPEWFEHAWTPVAVTKHLRLRRTLLFNKEEAKKRLGAGKIEDIFREEIKLLRDQIYKENCIVKPATFDTAPMLRLPFALVKQESVGHGCFHTGVLGTHKPLLRWLYDCGSWTKKEVLKERVDDYAARLLQDISRESDIDLLFASHFDADHVSGLDYLLRRTRATPVRVHTAIIPYMSPAAAFAVLARAVAEDNCTPELIEAVCRPVRFFASRGVKRVIFHMPKRRDGGGGDQADPRPEPPPSPPRGVPPGPELPDVMTPVFIKPDGMQPVEQPDPETGILVAVAEHGTVCGIAANGAWADWWFLPYAYEWAGNHAELIGVAKEIVGLGPGEPGFYARLPEQLQSKEGVRRVKSIFAALDSNETSLSLYAGSDGGPDTRRVYGSAQGARPAGWLLTGDAKLSTRARMAEWKETFNSTSCYVGHLMIPHHGAEDNFNAGLLTYAPNARHFVTVNAQDDKIRKRPHGTVRDEFDAAEKTFHVVSEQKTSCIAEVSGPTDSNDDDRHSKVSKW